MNKKMVNSVEFELVAEFKSRFVKADADSRMMSYKKKEDELLDSLCGAAVYMLKACKANYRYQYYEKEMVGKLIDAILDSRKKK